MDGAGVDNSLAWVHQQQRLLALYRSFDHASGLEDRVPEGDVALNQRC